MDRVQTVEFVAAGSPRGVARAIEACADEQRMLSALVVPWESSRDALNIAVTSARKDGWAIEHTNLGTIRLTDLGDERTAVEITTDAANCASDSRLARLFDEFSGQLRRRFEVRA
jgi:hypothetical protein